MAALGSPKLSFGQDFFSVLKLGLARKDSRVIQLRFYLHFLKRESTASMTIFCLAR